MKNETKTIISGIGFTLLALMTALFCMYVVSNRRLNASLRNEQMVNANIGNSYNTASNGNFEEIEIDNNSNSTNNSTNQNENNNTQLELDYNKQNARIVTLYLFRGQGCPHCEHAIEFFNSILNDYNIEVQSYEVWKNANNKNLMTDVANKINAGNVTGVPFIVFEDGEYLVGFGDSSKNKILEKVVNLSKGNNIDVVKEVIDNYTLEVTSDTIR